MSALIMLSIKDVPTFASTLRSFALTIHFCEITRLLYVAQRLSRHSFLLKQHQNLLILQHLFTQEAFALLSP